MVSFTGTEIDGSRVEVVLAKPVDKNDPSRQKKAAQEQQAALAANPFFQVPRLNRILCMTTLSHGLMMPKCNREQLMKCFR